MAVVDGRWLSDGASGQRQVQGILAGWLAGLLVAGVVSAVSVSGGVECEVAVVVAWWLWLLFWWW